MTQSTIPHPLIPTPTHLSSGDQQVLQVICVAAQPVLQGLHKVACVLGLVARQELQHLGQGAHELEQALLKVVVVLQVCVCVNVKMSQVQKFKKKSVVLFTRSRQQRM